MREMEIEFIMIVLNSPGVNQVLPVILSLTLLVVQRRKHIHLTLWLTHSLTIFVGTRV